MQIIALHGFLCTPQDWDLCKIPNLLGVDLHNPAFPPPSKGFHAWTEAFIDYVKKLPAAPRILMGYSMGGRLALHVFIREPSLWKGAVFISTHPGLKTAEEKILRLANDQKWAQRFQTEPWEPLMKDWNAQAVFKNSVIPHRPESAYQRADLAEDFTGWSVAHQDDLSHALYKVKVPYTWAVGEHDAKFKSIAPCKPYVVSDAGHRIPFDKPLAVKDLIKLHL